MMNEDEYDIECRPGEIVARDYDDAREHPTIEQLLLKTAVGQLTAHQQTIWELYAYEQLTHEEIARQLGITERVAQRQVKTIEDSIKQYCEQNRAAYMLLKLEQKIMSEEK